MRKYKWVKSQKSNGLIIHLIRGLVVSTSRRVATIAMPKHKMPFESGMVGRGVHMHRGNEHRMLIGKTPSNGTRRLVHLNASGAVDCGCFVRRLPTYLIIR